MLHSALLGCLQLYSISHLKPMKLKVDTHNLVEDFVTAEKNLFRCIPVKDEQQCTIISDSITLVLDRKEVPNGKLFIGGGTYLPPLQMT